MESNYNSNTVTYCDGTKDFIDSVTYYRLYRKQHTNCSFGVLLQDQKK